MVGKLAGINSSPINFKFPLSKEYIQLLKGKSYHADKIFAEHGIEVQNYVSVFQQYPHYFLNQDHLNQQGSTQFLELLFHKKNAQ